MPTKMKRVNAYILSLLALLGLAACTSVEIPTKETIPDHCIELTLGNIHPSLQTKAIGHSRGDDTYHENLVESVDCFFYPDGAIDRPAVFTALGRGAEPVAEGDSTVYKVKIFFTDADAQKIFGSTTSGTGQFYVICNAPLSYGSDTSVPALKELVVENDFSAQTIQGSFVMPAEEPATVTLTTDGDVRSAGGRIYVKRSAAKIQLFLHIPETFVDESNEVWEPVMEAGVQIMMANAVKRGKVDGTYAVQSSDYISTPYRPVVEMLPEQIPEGQEFYNYSHVPFYSYPSAWTDLSDYGASYVFRIPWRIRGAGAYQWKSYQLSPNLVGQKFESNHFYRTYVKISSLGGADVEHSVVIADCDYVVVDWMDEAEGIVPGDLTKYNYLVVDQAEQELDNEETAAYTYVTSSPLKANGGVVITKIIKYDFTVRDSKQELTSGAAFNAALASIEIDYSHPGTVYITHSLDGVYCQWEVFATFTNEDGISEEVHFVQNPSIRLFCDYDKSGNVFVDGFFARVTPSPGFGVTRTIDGVTYYRGPGSNATSDHLRLTNLGSSNNYDLYGSISFGTDGYRGKIYTTEIFVSAFNTSNESYQFNLDNVGNTEKYRIGDPRKPAGEVFGSSWTPFPYLTYWNGTNNNNNTYGNWVEPGRILVTDPSRESQNIIAPRFLITSGLNSQGTKPTGYNNSVQRAATYQEAGYPAGRWRLPTEAEVAFIIARQQDGTIPDLFTTSSSGYWTASGKRLQLSTGGTINFSTVNNQETAQYSSRFVYDLWYWGDEALETNVYHPNSHLVTY